jgi:hypothetical protein
VSVEGVVTQVVEVLRRAESLFASPADTAISGAVDAVTGAAEASRAIGARTDELGGALVSAHHDLLGAAASHLEQSAATDARLADLIASASHTHADGGSAATDVRLSAEDVASRLGPWSDIPAGELAGLLALRNRVADMHRLLADHTSEARRAAEAIVSLGYQ